MTSIIAHEIEERYPYTDNGERLATQDEVRCVFGVQEGVYGRRGPQEYR